MLEVPLANEEKPRIREMTIDDLSEVFHIGEEVFTAEYFHEWQSRHFRRAVFFAEHSSDDSNGMRLR